MPPPDQLAGLGNKGLDAAYMFQAAVCAAERRNLGVALRPYLDDVAPGLHSGLTTYGDQFIRDKSRAARGFMVAYLKAVRDYTDAQRYGVDRAQIVEILQKAVPMQDPSYYDECEWGRINPDGYIDRKLIDEEILWSVQVGLIDRAVPADQFVDDQFVDYALQVIGRYQPKSP